LARRPTIKIFTASLVSPKAGVVPQTGLHISFNPMVFFNPGQQLGESKSRENERKVNIVKQGMLFSGSNKF